MIGILLALPQALGYIRPFFEAVLDPDRDGVSTREELLSYLRQMDPQAQPQEPRVQEAADQFDLDKDGLITLAEFQHVASAFIPKYRPGPKEVHIGLTNQADEMQVMWVSRPDVYDYPVVQFGTDPVRLKFQVIATWTTYNVGHLGFNGRIYRAVLGGLTPGERYFYRVGDFKTGLYSHTFNFTLPHPPGERNHSRLVVFGDMGVIPFGYRISKDIEFQVFAKGAELVLLAGDIAYAGIGSEDQGELEPVWDVFGNMIERWACCVPFMPGLGNHEKYYNYSSYSHRYVLPRSPGTDSNQWFYFDFANVRIVHFSSEHPYENGTQQFAFIQRALAQSKARWKILACHRPLISSDADGFDGHKPGSHLYETMLPLIRKYRVDIVFNGHQHVYERNDFFPGNGSHYVDPEDAIYIIQGNAGALIRDKFVNPRPEWSKVRTARYGYGVLQTDGDTLRYQSKLMRSAYVVDEWSITKTK